MAISMLKIRRPLGRLIFDMGIAIPGKTVFPIETAPRLYIHFSSSAVHTSQVSAPWRGDLSPHPLYAPYGFNWLCFFGPSRYSLECVSIFRASHLIYSHRRLLGKTMTFITVHQQSGGFSYPFQLPLVKPKLGSQRCILRVSFHKRCV